MGRWHRLVGCYKAIQNKLYGLSQDFFQKERASEAKHARVRKKRSTLFGQYSDIVV